MSVFYSRQPSIRFPTSLTQALSPLPPIRSFFRVFALSVSKSLSLSPSPVRSDSMSALPSDFPQSASVRQAEAASSSTHTAEVHRGVASVLLDDQRLIGGGPTSSP